MAKEPRSAYPGYTCSSIDNALSSLDHVKDEIEELRSNNSLLREWADFWEQELEEARENLASLEDEIATKDSLITEMQLELERLSRQIPA